MGDVGGWRASDAAKLVSVAEAAALVEDGDVLWAGAWCSNPVQLLEALTDRVDRGDGPRDVDVVTLLQCAPHRFNGGQYAGHLASHSMFAGPVERRFAPEGNVHVNSVHLGESGAALRDVYGVNTLFVEVSEPDEQGWMSYGPMGVAWNGPVASYATKRIVQVNACQGRVRGRGSLIHVDDVDAICRADHELAELIQPPVDEIDHAIAAFIIPNIPDGATLQVGLGGIANAVAYGLRDTRHLGVHTEMLTDSLVELARVGAVEHDKVLAGFGLGSRAVYDYCASGLPELGEIGLVNRPQLAAANDLLVSINSCLMVDLTGQVGSESIGHRQFSGTGGQLDYVRAAGMSKGGQSYLCLRSTVEGQRGPRRSTITLDLPPGQVVTTPRSDVMFVVTEWGIARLHNRPIEDRVRAMIAIAHPDYRDDLRAQAAGARLLHG